MSAGIRFYASDIFLYLFLLGSGATVVVSTIFLIVRGKAINITTKIIMAVLITMALSITISLVFLTLAFGNAHPSAFPVPLQ